MTAQRLKDRDVLVVDDDVGVGMVLSGLLQQAGANAKHVTDAAKALQHVATEPVDLVLTDLRMPGMDGMELLRELRRREPELPVIMLTAHGTITTAVEAMKAGAADFLTKPFEREQVVFTVDKALASVEQAAERPPALATASQLLGDAPSMRDCIERIERAARSQAIVLVRGETGSGKEVVARAIHERSSRKDEAFVAVNCAALPEQLLESELFGYEKGAFTGATARKPGRVRLAEGGTLFLDEIGDTSPALQLSLLRLLQEREYTPLGATRSVKADVRFVAATHQALESLVESGQFREDLYYRLNVVPILVPPLRDRRADIATLATSFCAKLGEANGNPKVRLSDAALEQLSGYDWPGNVRQLQNFVERLIVFCDTDRIDEVAVRRELERSPRLVRRQPSAHGVEASAESTERGSTVVAMRGHLAGAEHAAGPADPGSADPSLAETRRTAEHQAVREALLRSNNNRSQAARLLGISRRTLYKRLTEMSA